MWLHVPDVMNIQFMLHILRKQFMNIRVSKMTVRDNQNNGNFPFLLICAEDQKRNSLSLELFQVLKICKYCLYKPRLHIRFHGRGQ